MKNKPFLKWAGGKFRLIDTIACEMQHGKRLVEPFAGSASVYLNSPQRFAWVNDINKDLIQLFSLIQSEGKDFIDFCGSFFTPGNNTPEKYNELREIFNDSTDMRLRAAIFLYFNRHCFNGLIRYNSKGKFNVPFGKYKAPNFPREQLLGFYLKSTNTKTSFTSFDFRYVFSQLEDGDVVYCDPPYAPLSATANFTSYAGSAFSQKDQVDLANLAKEASNKGIKVIISNHNVSEVRNLYHTARLKEFDVQRFISCKGNNRGTAPELLAIYGESSL